MITYFCPNCWHTVSEEDKKCPHCGYDLTLFHSLPYEKKLVMGLRHPIREVKLSVFYTIVKKNLYDALPDIEKTMEEEENPMVLVEMVKALALMKTPKILGLLQKLTRHRYPIVQHQARLTLDNLLSEKHGGAKVPWDS